MSATPETSIEVMSRTVSLLRGLLDGLPDELLAVRDEEGWGPSTVVAHMVAIEPVALVDRVRRIHAEERPAVPDIDESANLEESGLRNMPLTDLLGRFERQRLETLEFLRSLDGAGWQRTGLHSSVGEITAANVLHHFANHDLLHLEQISTLVRGPINDGRGSMGAMY